MIGEKIKALRLKNKLTQETMAGMLGVSPQAVSKWELGIASPDISMLVPIADLFKTSVDCLLREDWQAKKIDNSMWKVEMSELRNGIARFKIKNLSQHYIDKLSYEIIFRDKEGEMIHFHISNLYELPPDYSASVSALYRGPEKIKSADLIIRDYKVKFR